jgi:hypothetical protein
MHLKSGPWIEYADSWKQEERQIERREVVESVHAKRKGLTPNTAHSLKQGQLPSYYTFSLHFLFHGCRKRSPETLLYRYRASTHCIGELALCCKLTDRQFFFLTDRASSRANGIFCSSLEPILHVPVDKYNTNPSRGVQSRPLHFKLSEIAGTTCPWTP